MAGTTTKVRGRAAARRNALQRQQKLNAERARRDEQELDLAADFAVASGEADVARAAVRAAELALGRVVDSLIGGLRIRYERAAVLLDTAEDELRRLRQIATDATGEPTPPATRPAGRTGRRARTRPAPATAAPETPTGAADGDQLGDPGTDAGAA
jgi:hypothetical protein